MEIESRPWGMYEVLLDSPVIKIRIRETDKNKRSKQCIQIQKHLSAEIIHVIGFIIVLYRPKPENL